MTTESTEKADRTVTARVTTKTEAKVIDFAWQNSKAGNTISKSAAAAALLQVGLLAVEQGHFTVIVEGESLIVKSAKDAPTRPSPERSVEMEDVPPAPRPARKAGSRPLRRGAGSATPKSGAPSPDSEGGPQGPTS